MGATVQLVTAGGAELIDVLQYRRFVEEIMNRASASKVIAPAALLLVRNGWMPSNERLPVLHYRGVLCSHPELATFWPR